MLPGLIIHSPLLKKNLSDPPNMYKYEGNINIYSDRRKDETIVPDWRLIRRQTKLEVFAN